MGSVTVPKKTVTPFALGARDAHCATRDGFKLSEILSVHPS